jgi:beta-glucosidase
VLVFLGEEAILSGEAHSLADLNLKGAQSELLAAIHATGKPVVATVMAGRPLTIERDIPNCEALLYAFHPGTMGGSALANLLSGTVNPSGKTPVTFLRTVGQAPLYYAHNMTGRPYNNETLLEDIELEAGQTSLGNTSYYLDYGAYPLFPFGYGLSYTTFAYSEPVVRQKGDKIIASVKVTNTGSVAGKEAVGLYVHAPLGSFTDKPERELRAFGKTRLLQPGESQVVDLSFPVRDLASFNSALSRWETAKGAYTVYFGADCRQPAASLPLKLAKGKNYPATRACEPKQHETN